MTTITVPVAASGDDTAYVGTTVVNGATLSVGLGWASMVRFSVAVPQGATVTAASISFRSAATSTSGIPVTALTGYATDNAAMPANGTNVGALPRTTASTAWTPPGWVLGTTYTSSDLSAVIGEITSRPGWVSGNDLLLFWTGDNSGTITASSYDDAPTHAPILTVTYTATAGVTGTSAQQLPALAQSASGTVALPAYHATVTQTVPAVTQAAAGTFTGPPFTVTATPSGADVDLSWAARGDAASYVVERDGTIIAYAVSGTTYTDTPGSGTHTYRVGVTL